MAFELQYTSAPRTLIHGHSGFGTVKMTRGMPLVLREALEALSSYQHVHPATDPRVSKNPICYGLCQVMAGGKRWYVISRSSDAGMDHTHRTNFFAHHIAFAKEETRELDPIALLDDKGTFAAVWDAKVEELEQGRKRPTPHGSTYDHNGPLSTDWNEFVVGEALAGETVYIVTQSNSSLAIIKSLMASVPAAQRWELTFTSYFQSVSPAVQCSIRCVAPDSETARKIDPSRSKVIDLTHPLPAAPRARRTAATVSAPAPQTSSAGEGFLPHADAPGDAYPLQPKVVASSASHYVNGPAILETARSQPAQNRSFGSGLAVGALVGLLLALMLAVPVLLVLQSQKSQRAKTNDDLSERIQKLKTENKILEDNKKELKEQVESLLGAQKESLERYNDERRESKKEIANKDDVIKKLQETLKESGDELADAVKKNEAIKNESEDWKNKYTTQKQAADQEAAKKNAEKPTDPTAKSNTQAHVPIETPHVTSPLPDIDVDSSATLYKFEKGRPKKIESKDLESIGAEPSTREPGTSVNYFLGKPGQKRVIAKIEVNSNGEMTFKWTKMDDPLERLGLLQVKPYLEKSSIKATFESGESLVIRLAMPPSSSK